MSVTLASLDDLEAVVARLIDQRPRPLVVDRRDACRMLAVSDSTFGRLVRAGHIAPVPHLSPKRYSVAALEAFVSAGASTSAAPSAPAAGVDGPAGTTGTTAALPGVVSPLTDARGAGDRQGPTSTARGGPSTPAA